jgi:hypothetical protein
LGGGSALTQVSIRPNDSDGDLEASINGTEAGAQRFLPPETNQTPQEIHDDAEKYFKIEYTFTMQFDGLLAKYEFWCEKAQHFEAGSVSLPSYELGR